MSRKIAYAGMLLAVDTVLFLMVNVFQTNTIFLLGVDKSLINFKVLSPAVIASTGQADKHLPQ